MSQSKKRRRCDRKTSTWSRRDRERQVVTRLLGEALEQRMLLTTVTSIEPLANSHSVPVSTDVAATFDQNINPETATPQTFNVHSSQRGSPVEPAATVTTTSATVTLNPTSDFFPGELVQVTATSGIQSTGADPVEPHVWEFRTAASGGTGVFNDSGQTLDNHVTPGVALGDLDGDGDLDAFGINPYYADRVWINDGGVFTDSGQRLGGDGGGQGISLGDLDGDGDLDALVANGGQDGVNAWVNDGGVFSFAQTLGNHDSESVSLGDLDGDGDLDAFVANDRDDHSRVWLNNGGEFSDSGQSLGNSRTRSVSLGDVDGDGDLDALVVDSEGFHLWMNSGGEFSDSGHTLGSDSNMAALGDVDGDGDLDAFVTNTVDEGNRVWVNNGSGEFSDSGQALGGFGHRDIFLGDLDGDGDLDAFVTRNFQESLVWLNDGAGKFLDTGQQIGTPNGWTAALGDLDGDGDLDAFLANTYSNGLGEQGNRIWVNQRPASPPTLSLSLDAGTIPEAAGVSTVTAALSAAVDHDVTANLRFTGTAAESDDYTVSATQIVVLAGATTGSITVTALQDDLTEPNETVVVDVTTVTEVTAVDTGPLTITITDDDGVESLLVTSLMPTDSGFEAELNSPLDTSTLNLYGPGTPSSDVVLSGEKSGPITGSLVVDRALQKVTFIKTGSPLAADTYTVTMRSGTEGFKDVADVQLDGDSDGTGGDGYSHTFTVVAQTADPRTISIPDFVRGPGQPVNLPANTTNGIPLTISDGAGVRSAEIQVAYDPSLLNISAAAVGSAMPAGATVELNITTPGNALLAFVSPVELPAGNAVLVNLQASVPLSGSSELGRQQVIDIHSVSITDANSNPLPAVGDDAVHLVGLFGDVTGNGRINASDAASVAQVAAELNNGFGPAGPQSPGAPLTDPMIVADISGNSQINATDASLLAQFAALMPVPKIPLIPEPGVIPVHASAFGTTYAQIQGDWFNWVMQEPAATSPILDETGEHCHRNQNGEIWYLGSNFGGTTERSCTIPTGKAVFVPIIGNGEWGCDTEAECRELAKETADLVSTVQATIDGREVNASQYRASSPDGGFVASIPPGSVLTGFGVPAGEYENGIADSFGLLLTPLSEGQHTIYAYGEDKTGFFSEVTYHLTVAKDNAAKKPAEETLLVPGVRLEHVSSTVTADQVFSTWVDGPLLPTARAANSEGGPQDWERAAPHDSDWLVELFLDQREFDFGGETEEELSSQLPLDAPLAALPSRDDFNT